ncbi:MAG: DUF1538 family protein [Lachnospiraceae bacterium]|nr:DUF1538 family protein [Lachnospiraceae bacterium]
MNLKLKQKILESLSAVLPITGIVLLPLSIGACEAVGGNVMTDAFGVVALVALTPLIAIQIMGLQYQYKLKKMEKTILQEAPFVDAEDEIYDFEEGYENDK